MKKMSVVVIALSLAVSMFSVANAGYRNGMGGGCGNCAQGGASSDQFRKFQADTIDLRQEMMTKRFEMQRENLKGTPDSGKIAALQADIKAIQTKIQDVRSQSGLPVGMRDGECGQRMGKAGKKGMGGCGKGMGGCNNGPCAQ
ncbi:MAG: hypothetical protein HGB32_15815 [Geobacteraceae bacterium]|nr:hypothetical protein [Geobacteraceae bacterium]NTW81589.1 hypothetical protein [Geobacteraceae bacterium]